MEDNNILLKPEDSRLIDIVLKEATYNSRKYFDSLTPHEKKYFYDIIYELKTHGYSDKLNLIWEADYEIIPPTVDEFLWDDYYLGKINSDPENGLYDFWADLIKYTVDPSNNIVEVIVLAARGSGKNTFAIQRMAYRLAHLLCLRDPARYYGLQIDTSLVLFFYNVDLMKAFDVGYNRFEKLLKRSPFFSQFLLRTKSPTAVVLPKSIEIKMGSQFFHGLSEAIYDCSLDEANFGKGSTSKEESQVMKNYRSVREGANSRFMRPGGIVSAQLCLTSSKRGESDALTRHAEASKSIPTTLVVDDVPLWKVKTKRAHKVISFYSGKTFRVAVGNQYRESRVLEDNEPDPVGMQVVKIPIEHYNSFRNPNTINEALQDIANVSTYGYGKLIKNRDKVRLAVKNCPIPQFFNTEQIILDFDNPTQKLQDYLNVNALKDWIDKNKFITCSVHFDVGLTGDKFGVGVSYISGRKLVSRFDQTTGYETHHEEYVYSVLLMAGISPLAGKQIPFWKIVTFFVWLRDELGLSIGIVSSDLGHSMAAMLLQTFKQNGFNTRKLSLDKTDVGYLTIRELYDEERILHPHHSLFLDELFNLEHDEKNRKVDHPETGSKDVADGVVGSIYNFIDAKELVDSYYEPTSIDEKEERHLMRELERKAKEEEIDKDIDFGFNRHTL